MVCLNQFRKFTPNSMLVAENSEREKPPPPENAPPREISAPRESLTFSDADIGFMKMWDSAKVASWLKQIGLSQFEEKFIENQITGDVLPVLGVEELREMGLTVIGPRTYLVKCLKKLKGKYRVVMPNAALRTGCLLCTIC